GVQRICRSARSLVAGCAVALGEVLHFAGAPPLAAVEQSGPRCAAYRRSTPALVGESGPSRPRRQSDAGTRWLALSRKRLQRRDRTANGPAPPLRRRAAGLGVSARAPNRIGGRFRFRLRPPGRSGHSFRISGEATA